MRRGRQGETTARQEEATYNRDNLLSDNRGERNELEVESKVELSRRWEVSHESRGGERRKRKGTLGWSLCAKSQLARALCQVRTEETRRPKEMVC